MKGIIDIHTHILPEIDDGSRNWDESRNMLEQAYQQGIRCILATPHYSRRGLPPGIYDLAERLQEEAQKIAGDYMTGLGQETYYHEGLVDNLKSGKALTLKGSRYVLVEFDPLVSYQTLYQGIRKLCIARYIPVIAHVERYLCMRKKGKLDELIQCGCRLQMNYSSLEGNGIWNREVRWCREQILEGRIHYLGTDMHRMDYRKPAIEKSLRWLEEHVSRNQIDALLRENAETILQQNESTCFIQ